MLKIVSEINEYFNQHSLVFCHWKSNEKLAKALQGDTDLDLLFDKNKSYDVEYILGKYNGIKFNAVREKRYSNIDDILILDNETAKLIHFHVHYEMDIGEKLVKSYSLPYTEEILSTRVKHPDYDFWISSPEWELFLLITRQALRLTPYNIIRKKLPSICKDIDSELVWLKNKYDHQSFEILVKEKLSDPLANEYMEIVSEGLKYKNILLLNRKLRSYYAKYRRYNHVNIFFKLFIKRASLKIKIKMNKYGIPVPYKRVMPNKGIVVAFIGCDGAGKSSLAKSVSDLYSKKIDVMNIYFGHGSSHKSRIIRPFKFIGSLCSKISIRLKCDLNIGRVIHSVGVILDKQIKVWRAELARDRGFLVVCDRFPQSMFNKINDGPWLSEYIDGDSNYILRKLAKWEDNVYQKSNNIKPEIVFKVSVDSDIAQERSGHTSSLENIYRKAEIVKALNYSDYTQVVNLDNNHTNFEIAKQQAVAHIWNKLYAQSV